ncbi:MAG: hypothetical protein JWL71_4810 [Acidobacteria bacterium]|nr:hypothetical protein [Acidobacteriota bacterium]
MSSEPWRGDGSGFALTRYATDPLPCPDVPEVMTTHGALVVAVHVQSRVVSTASVADMPLAGAAPAVPVPTVTLHLLSVGAMTDVDVDEPVHALARTHSEATANS